VSLARYVLGAVSLALVGGSMALAAVTVRRRFFAGWSGAPARLTELVLGLAMLIAILETLGAVGWFRLGPIVATTVAVGVGLAWLTGRGRPVATPARAHRGRPGSTATRLGVTPAAIALLAATAVLAEWAAPTLQSYDVGVRTFDSLWYHLPWAASFAQTGHTTPLRFTDVEYLTAFYPATAEVLHGLGIVLFANDTLSPGLNLIWLGLALLAAWCIGSSRGAGAAAVLGVALLMATPMMNTSQAGSAANDVVGAFFLLASVAFVLAGDGPRAGLAGDGRGAGLAGDGRRAEIVLAAVAAGLAMAVKLSLLAPVAALTAGAIAVAPTGRRRITAALWLGPLLLAGGYWYARNAIAVGNPLPWTGLGILPTPAAPLQQHTAFSVAHYLTTSGAWSRFWEPGLAAGLGRWWFVIVGAAVVGPLLCLLPGAGRTVRMLGLVALASLAAYLITPETAAGPRGDPAGFAFNLRYAAPSLALSLAILPLAPPLAGARRQGVLVGALAVALCATQFRSSLWPHRHVLGVVLLAAGLLLAGAALLAIRAGSRSRARGPSGRRSPSRALLLSGAALALTAGAAAGYAWQRHYLRGRYQFNPGVSYLARTWAFFRTVHDARVGVVGTFGGFFSYPLFGPDASNRVQYVGARGAHGSFTAITDCRRWREAINDGRYRYVVTTPARDPWHPKRLRPSPEAGWTGSDPNAHLVLSRRATGQPIDVYEIRGPLDPAGCTGRGA
jgi:hypothetical protein